MEDELMIFEGSNIRRKLIDGDWYFSVVDVIFALTSSVNARNYWKVLKHRLNNKGSQVVTNCNQLKFLASDNKMREIDVANTKTILRIIQSIPSKMWLAKVGSNRIDEIENPELTQDIFVDSKDYKLEKLYNVTLSPQYYLSRHAGLLFSFGDNF